MMSGTPAILIVEDEAVVALDLKIQLLDLGYDVSGIAASGHEAVTAVEHRLPDLILMDVRIQGAIDGIDVAKDIRNRHEVPVIFLTSHSDDETVGRAAATAPYGYLTKPYQARELRAGIEVALTKSGLERQVHESNRWFAQTLQWVPDGIVVTDLDGRIKSINPAAAQLTGWTNEEAAAKPVGEVIVTTPLPLPDGTADDRPRYRFDPTVMLHTALKLDRPSAIAQDILVTRRDGRETLIDQSAGPISDAKGRPLGAVLVLRDSSARAAQEYMLRYNEQHFRSIFDDSPLGTVVVSLSGNIYEVNRAFCRMLGRTADELMNRLHDSLLLQGSVLTSRDADQLLLGQVRNLQFEATYARAHGQAPLHARISASLLREADEPISYLYQVLAIDDGRPPGDLA